MDRDRLSQREQREASRHPPISGGLSEAVPCTSCGYDLQGSLGTGRCPECGTRIPPLGSQTLARFGAEPWLRNAERGVRMWRCGATGVVLSAVVLIASLLVPGAPWERDASYFLLWVGIIGLGVSASVAVCGMWQLSAHHPVIDRDEARLSARRVIRFVSVLTLSGVVLSLMPGGLRVAGSMRIVLSVVSGLGVGPLALIGVLAITRRVTQLCELADDEETASRVGFIGWAHAMAYVFLFGAFASTGLDNSSRLLIAFVSALAILIFGLLWIYTPSYLIPHFRAALDELERATTQSAAAAGTRTFDGIPPTTVSGSKEPHGS